MRAQSKTDHPWDHSRAATEQDEEQRGLHSDVFIETGNLVLSKKTILKHAQSLNDIFPQHSIPTPSISSESIANVRCPIH